MLAMWVVCQVHNSPILTLVRVPLRTDELVKPGAELGPRSSVSGLSRHPENEDALPQRPSDALRDLSPLPPGAAPRPAQCMAHRSALKRSRRYAGPSSAPIELRKRMGSPSAIQFASALRAPRGRCDGPL
jgi:hypothetical protein